MNANQIINMVVRLVMRRVVNAGVNKGIDAMSKRGKKGEATEAGQGPDTRAMQKSANQAIKMTRRMR